MVKKKKKKKCFLLNHAAEDKFYLCNPVCLGYYSLCIFQCAVTQIHSPEMGNISSQVKNQMTSSNFLQV